MNELFENIDWRGAPIDFINREILSRRRSLGDVVM